MEQDEHTWLMDIREALIEIVFLLRDIKDSLDKSPSNSKPTVKGGEGYKGRG